MVEIGPVVGVEAEVVGMADMILAMVVENAGK